MAAAVLAGTGVSFVPRAVAPSASAQEAALPEVVVNKFMSYDPAAKKVTLKLRAAVGSDNGGLNFNGGSRGDQTITVPLGWKIHVDFKNEDAIPHSAILLPDKIPVPPAPSQPAIGGAYTRDLSSGMPTDGTDTMDFTAAPAANYLMVCGVPGHGTSGMYIKFVVSATAKTPSYQM